MTRAEACLILNMVDHIGPVTVRRLSERFGSPEAILEAPERDLRTVNGVGREMARAIARWREEIPWQEEIENARAAGLILLCAEEPGYPTLLKQIHDPPLVLYARGRPTDGEKNSLAIVGARHPSHYGMEIARRFGFQFANIGMTVVSGLAAGIDTAAHRGCLQAKGRTVAVLGFGFDYLPKADNARLADEIVAGGGLLCLVGCVQGAATFGHERSQGSYDLLRSSPLAPWDIVTGKVTGGAVGLGFLFAVPLGHACLSALEGGAPLLPTTAGLLLCAALPLYWTVQGLSCSAKHDRVRPAMVRALAAFGAAAVALPLLGEAAQAGGILTRDQVDWCQMGSPPATVAGVLEGFGHLWEGGAWDWDDDGPKAISWCLLMAAGAFGHAVIMRFRLAARFEEDRES